MAELEINRLFEQTGTYQESALSSFVVISLREPLRECVNIVSVGNEAGI